MARNIQERTEEALKSLEKHLGFTVAVEDLMNDLNCDMVPTSNVIVRTVQLADRYGYSVSIRRHFPPSLLARLGL